MKMVDISQIDNEVVIAYDDGSVRRLSHSEWLDEMDGLFGWDEHDIVGEQFQPVERWEEANSLTSHTGRMHWK